MTGPAPTSSGTGVVGRVRSLAKRTVQRGSYPPVHYGTEPAPAIHGPRIVGGTPGRPFLFLIPATGAPPLSFTVDNLPAGLTLDGRSGVISGRLAAEGETDVTIRVVGAIGSATGRLRIVSGERKLALTPPMGWNSWNVWGRHVDDRKVRAAADWLVRTGLAAHGYQYVNIDDGWEGSRDSDGRIRPNEKFPDMRGLADYVHKMGLKLGIYSSPGRKTCEGFEGSYGYEQLDAETWASWGIDYLKHDWCSYAEIAVDKSRPELEKPYRVMREALNSVDRDIVYSIAQYGMGEIWKWGEELGANSWRTTGDLFDLWPSLDKIGFSHDGRERYAGPGHWNDADMLVLGRLGWGRKWGTRRTKLTPNEQLLHMTMWCLLASPLMIGCDLSRLDKFTLALLTNQEVIAVNQDLLGVPAGRNALDGQTEVWSRPLSDGTVAAGLFNRGETQASVTAEWSALGLNGPQLVRDMWRRSDIGRFESCYSASVPPHGCVLVRVGHPGEPAHRG
jgi:alpha-galactosidase